MLNFVAIQPFKYVKPSILIKSKVRYTIGDFELVVDYASMRSLYIDIVLKNGKGEVYEQSNPSSIILLKLIIIHTFNGYL